MDCFLGFLFCAEFVGLFSTMTFRESKAIALRKQRIEEAYWLGKRDGQKRITILSRQRRRTP